MADFFFTLADTKIKILILLFYKQAFHTILLPFSVEKNTPHPSIVSQFIAPVEL